MKNELGTSKTIEVSLQAMLTEYRRHLMPIDEVKQVLGAEIPEEVELSEELVAKRKLRFQTETSKDLD